MIASNGIWCKSSSHILLEVMPCRVFCSFFSGKMPKSYDEALLTACEKGHPDLIRPLVKAGASVDGSELSTLYVAIRNRHVNCIKNLISLGIDVKAGYPVVSAIEHFGDHVEVLQLLIDSGADVNKKLLDDYPLEYACRQGYTVVAAALLKAGAHLNVHVKRGRGPLIIASRNGHDAVVNLLIKFANDKNMTILGRDIALIKASSRGHINIVKTIVKLGVDVNSVVSSKPSFRDELEVGGHCFGISCSQWPLHMC